MGLTNEDNDLIDLWILEGQDVYELLPLVHNLSVRFKGSQTLHPFLQKKPFSSFLFP